LKKYEIHQAATTAATEISDVPIAKFPNQTDSLPIAG